MSILLDLLVLLLIALAVFLGYKRGFVKTAVKFGGFFLSVVVASIVANFVGHAIFDSLIRPTLVENVATQVTNSGIESIDGAVRAVFANVPEFVSNMLEAAGISAEGIANAINLSDASEAVAEAIALAVEPAITSLLAALVFTIVFGILMMIVRLVTRSLKFVNSVPIVGQANQLIGGGIGFLNGVFWLLLIGAFLSVLAAFLGDTITNLVDSTYIFKIFYKYNFLNINNFLR